MDAKNLTEKEIEDIDRELANDQEIQELKEELIALRYMDYRYYMIEEMKRDIEILKLRISDREKRLRVVK